MAKPSQAPESIDVQALIGGRALVLRFSLRAVSALKDHWGLTSDDPEENGAKGGDEKVNERVQRLQTEDCPTMIWAFCRKHHPELTLEEVYDLVDDNGLAGIPELLMKVVQAAAPPASARPRPAAAGKTR